MVNISIGVQLNLKKGSTFNQKLFFNFFLLINSTISLRYIILKKIIFSTHAYNYVYSAQTNILVVQF